MNLADLLSPLSEDEFVAGYWGSRCVHIPGPADKFAGLNFGRAQFFEALASIEGRYHELGECRVKASYAPAGGGGPHVEIRSPPSMAAHLLRAGMTISAHHLEHVYAGMAAAGRALQAGLGTTYTRVNAFLSPPGGGLSAHFDYDHVFVLQLEGEKAWRFSPTAEVDAPGECAIHGADADEKAAEWGAEAPAPNLDALATARLTPGDVLYLPPGAWHTPAAGSEGSLHVSLSVAPVNFRFLAEDLIRESFVRDPEWRRHLPLARGARDGLRGGTPEPMRAFLEARLGELKRFVAGLEVGAFLPIVANHLHHRPPGQSAASCALTPEARLRVAWGSLPIVTRPDGEDCVELFASGERLRLHVGAASLLNALAERDRFTASEATAWLGQAPVAWATVQPLLQELVQVGLLEEVK